jgi:glutamate-1-semialdehyde aminotransferase
MHAGGGHFQPYFTGEHVIDYRSAATTDAAAYARWRTTLESRGLIPASKPLLHAAFSAAHADADLEALLDASRAAFAEMAR